MQSMNCEACGQSENYWATLQHHLSFHRTRQQVAVRATWQWLSAHLCQADTEKMTVNQLTLHFLGRHEWEIKIVASAMYNVPHARTHTHTRCVSVSLSLSLTYKLAHTITVSHRSTAALWPQLSLDIFSCLQSIYQSSDRKDASLTFPIMSTTYSDDDQNKTKTNKRFWWFFMLFSTLRSTSVTEQPPDFPVDPVTFIQLHSFHENSIHETNLKPCVVFDPLWDFFSTGEQCLTDTSLNNVGRTKDWKPTDLYCLVKHIRIVSVPRHYITGLVTGQVVVGYL